MCKPVCPFAAALFGGVAGSSVGAAVGATSGWMLYAAYAGSGGRDVCGLALLIFGTLGLGIGGSGGAVGGLIEGWNSGEASAVKWGAVLGGLWGLQPILWLSLSTDAPTAIRSGAGIAATVIGLGAIAARLGSLAARSVVRSMGLIQAPAMPAGKRCK